MHTVVPLWWFHLMFFSVLFLSFGILASALTVCSSDTVPTFIVAEVAGAGMRNVIAFIKYHAKKKIVSKLEHFPDLICGSVQSGMW